MFKNEKTMVENGKVQIAISDWMSGCKFTPPRSIPSNIEYYESVDGERFMKTTILIPLDKSGIPQFSAFPDTFSFLSETMVDGKCYESRPILLANSVVNSVEPIYSIEMWVPGLTQAYPGD